MKQTSALPALINSIREAYESGNKEEASRLFQVLYASLRTHLWDVYCGVLYAKFRTNTVSLRAELVFLKILTQLERAISIGKFVAEADETDADIRKRLAKRIGLQAYQRTVDAMKAWTRTPTHREADLQISALEDIADEQPSDPEDDRIVQQRIASVLGKMRERDAQILRTRFYSDLSKEEAEQTLMTQFSLTAVGLEKAITRAKERFRQLWVAHLNAPERKPSPT